MNNQISKLSVSVLLLSALAFTNLNAQSNSIPEYVEYYFVELIQNQPSEELSDQEIRSTRMEHLANIRKLASERKLLLAGPFKDGGGLFILNAESSDQAEEWVLEDPAVKAGLFTYKIRVWVTEKGLLTLENLEN